MVLATSRLPDLSALSESDLDAVQAGFIKATGLVLTERTAETHDRDWEQAPAGRDGLPRHGGWSAALPASTDAESVVWLSSM